MSRPRRAVVVRGTPNELLVVFPQPCAARSTRTNVNATVSQMLTSDQIEDLASPPLPLPRPVLTDPATTEPF